MRHISYGRIMRLLSLPLLVVFIGLVVACKGGGQSPAEKVYVPPGKLDTYYAFLSGGHSGQVGVFGLPSGRLIKMIPVFAPDVAIGWGIDEKSKEIMGGYIWGDAHHPALSETMVITMEGGYLSMILPMAV